MRIPFLPNLNVGTDIIAYHRLLKPNTSTSHLRRLALRFLHPHEVCDLDKRFPDWRNLEKVSLTQRLKFGAHLAGRWAAKEAAKKAWGATLISFKDLRVETLSDGQVQIVCQSYHDTKSTLVNRRIHDAVYEQVAKLSISHDGDYAVATVIATPLHPAIMADLQSRKSLAVDRVMGVKSPLQTQRMEVQI